MQGRARVNGLLLVLVGVLACAADPAVSNEPAVPGQDGLPNDPFIQKTLQPWKGDLDGMVERRLIRALVAYNRTSYYLDGADQQGLSYEALTEFAAQVNKELKTGSFEVQVAFLPVSRDRLIPYLLEGRGDIAVGNLTITPERLELVDFSDPLYTGVKELIVTHSSIQDLNTLEDLSGREIYVRESSSYYQSLLKLNRSLKEAGRQEVVVTKADENLETDDILEMVNAGLVKITVADEHLVDLWEQVFRDIRVYRSLIPRSGGSIGWAFRKESPALKKTVNAFVKTHKQGTLFGNILINRYLRDTKHVENALGSEQVAELSKMAGLFRKYGDEYGLEWLLLAAQAYQESKLNQAVQSRVGAIGVMQIRPSTARDPNVNIPEIGKLENNIHAGTKYVRFLTDRYFDDPELDDVNRHLFSLAAYNAGPRRIVAARRQASEMGYDPNEWFQNVEILVAKEVGRQPVEYVSNIYKYYLSYQFLLNQRDAKGRILRGTGIGDR